MKLAKYVTLLGLGLLAGVQACGEDEPTNGTTSFQLTFQGDMSFQGAHAGHAISVAVVRTSDGMVVATQTGTVSGTTDPAFSFTFAGALEEGTAYQVHYWIDSNFGGGTVGVCDPTMNDHQWSVPVPAASADLTLTESHDAGALTDVCTTFP